MQTEKAAPSRRAFVAGSAALALPVALPCAPAIARLAGGLLTPADAGGDLAAWARLRGRKYLPAGLHAADAPLVFSAGDDVDCHRDALVVPSEGFQGDSLAWTRGEVRELPPLAEAVGTGSDRIAFAAPHAMRAGDALLIADTRQGTFWPFARIADRRRYRAGVIARVADVVDAGTVALRTSLFLESHAGSLEPAHSRLLAVRAPSHPVFFRLNVDARGKAMSALRITGACDLVLLDVMAGGAYDYGIWLEQSVDVRLVNTTAYCRASARGRQYGLAIIGCGDTTVDRGTFHGTRHAITVSGGGGRESGLPFPPSDRTLVRGARMTSTAGQAADTSHAPNIRTRFVDCTATGLSWGGADGSWLSGAISGGPGANSACLFASEMASVIAPARWIYEKDGTEPHFKGVIDLDGSGRALGAATHRGGTLTVAGRVEAGALRPGMPLVRAANNGFGGAVLLALDLRHDAGPGGGPGRVEIVHRKGRRIAYQVSETSSPLNIVERG